MELHKILVVYFVCDTDFNVHVLLLLKMPFLFLKAIDPHSLASKALKFEDIRMI